MFACYGASGSSGLFQSCTSHSTLSYLVSHNFLSVSFDRNKHEMASPNATFSPAASSPSFDSDTSPYSDDEFTRMELSSRGGTPASATKIDSARKREIRETLSGQKDVLKRLLMPSAHSSDFLSAPKTTGSEDDPHIIHVDVKFPERNREFNIKRVQQMEDKAISVNGFLIRKTIPPPNANYWKAYIPTRLKHLKKRAIMVKGPSRSYWYRDNVHCKQAANRCTATETALLASHCP